MAAATNDVRNAFTPVGNADLALMDLLLVVGAYMGMEAELGQALAMLTTEPARPCDQVGPRDRRAPRDRRGALARCVDGWG